MASLRRRLALSAEFIVIYSYPSATPASRSPIYRSQRSAITCREIRIWSEEQWRNRATFPHEKHLTGIIILAVAGVVKARSDVTAFATKRSFLPIIFHEEIYGELVPALSNKKEY